MLLNAGILSQGGDPFFDDVILLLKMDGANNSTTFTDSSPLASSVTRVGSAKISTAQSVFGGSSGLFAGATGDCLNIADRTEFTMSGDFSIEWWMNITSKYESGGANDCPISLGSTLSTATPAILLAYSGSTYSLLYYPNTEAINTGLVLNIGQWHFCQCIRSSGTIRMYVDGTQRGTNYSNSTTINPTIIRISASTNNSFGRINGYLDDFRITKDVARSSSVPTSGFLDY